ncbi:reverse transcriptase domain-containing protein [Tanacetum coccineum]
MSRTNKRTNSAITSKHYSGKKPDLLQRFYWPTIIKEVHTLVRLCEACQKTGNISKRDEMPLTNIQVEEAQALPTNDARVVFTFLKKLFSLFRIPKTLMSDRGSLEDILRSNTTKIKYLYTLGRQNAIKDKVQAQK